MATKRKRRRFTPEFKAEVVIEALSGQSSPAERLTQAANIHKKALDWVASNPSEE